MLIKRRPTATDGVGSNAINGRVYDCAIFANH